MVCCSLNTNHVFFIIYKDCFVYKCEIEKSCKIRSLINKKYSNKLSCIMSKMGWS